MKSVIHCPECKTELSEQAKFCPECGKPVPKPEPKEELKEETYSPVLKVDGAAKLLKISRCYVYTLINEEGLPWFPIGKDKRFLASELLEWAKSRQIVNQQKAG